jgi:very-short-patch-repair endonuclease
LGPMGPTNLQRGIVRWQHGVLARWQLLARGYTERAIKHHIETKWLHPIFAGVYAVGRPEVSRFGMWMAAVLASGPFAVISHDTAAALWGIWTYTPELIVSVPAHCRPRNPGIRVHRRAHIDATTHHRIPVTTPTATLIDFAATHPRNEVEAALNEADIKGLIKLESLREELESAPRMPGLAKLRSTIDRRTFTFTRSDLERAFRPLARGAGMTNLQSRVYVNGHEVDFYSPDLGLVIETDGGTFHRTPAQQAADRRRDHAHIAAGLTPLRFTHGQIRYERAYVEETLTTVAARLARA